MHSSRRDPTARGVCVSKKTEGAAERSFNFPRKLSSREIRLVRSLAAELLPRQPKFRNCSSRYSNILDFCGLDPLERKEVEREGFTSLVKACQVRCGQRECESEMQFTGKGKRPRSAKKSTLNCRFLESRRERERERACMVCLCVSWLSRSRKSDRQSAVREGVGCR